MVKASFLSVKFTYVQQKTQTKTKRQVRSFKVPIFPIFTGKKASTRPFHTMTFPADRRSDQRRQRMQQLLGEMEEVEEEEVLRGRAQKHRFYHVFPIKIHHLSSVYPSFILWLFYSRVPFWWCFTNHLPMFGYGLSCVLPIIYPLIIWHSYGTWPSIDDLWWFTDLPIKVIIQ